MCQADTDCGSEKKQCHKVGSGGMYRACCPIGEEYQCPGGVYPTKVKDKLNHESSEDFKCGQGEFAYDKGSEKLCCRKFFF